MTPILHKEIEQYLLQPRGVAACNSLVYSHSGFRTSIIPLRDGLAVSQKIQ